MTFTKEIIFPFDLKGRTAARFVQESAYNTYYTVFLRKDNREVNINSLLGVLSLTIKKGTKVELVSHEEEALNKILKVIEQINFESKI